FSGTLIGNTVSRTVTIRNAGGPGAPSIMVDPAQMQITGPGAAQFTAQTTDSAPVTLAAGDSLVVMVRFTAADAAAKSAALQIPHTGANTRLTSRSPAPASRRFPRASASRRCMEKRHRDRRRCSGDPTIVYTSPHRMDSFTSTT